MAEKLIATTPGEKMLLAANGHMDELVDEVARLKDLERNLRQQVARRDETIARLTRELAEALS